jgi:hypothetical protein
MANSIIVSAEGTVRYYLEAFAQSATKAARSEASARERKEGAYTLAVQAAIVAADGAEFKAVMDAFKKDIQRNTDGIAKALKCEVNTRNAERFKVPVSVSSAASNLERAFKYNVALVKDGEPRSFHEIRKEASLLAKAEADAALSGDAKLRRDVAIDLDAIKDRLDKLEGAQLAQLAQVVTAISESLKAKSKSRDSAAKRMTEVTDAVPFEKPAKPAQTAKATRQRKTA